MTKRKTDEIDRALAARRRRVLAGLIAAVLAELSPNEEHRAAAARQFQAVLDEPWWQ
jgi:hypothetical protein